MTSDMGEMFNALKKKRQAKRADNRENSAEYLSERGIIFVAKNNGAHLIVEGAECFIDFWPGTGKWHSRCGKKGFGVRNLVAFIGTPSNVAGNRLARQGQSELTGLLARWWREKSFADPLTFPETPL